jgi:hypothetical protein
MTKSYSNNFGGSIGSGLDDDRGRNNELNTPMYKTSDNRNALGGGGVTGTAMGMHNGSMQDIWDVVTKMEEKITDTRLKFNIVMATSSPRSKPFNSTN